MLLRLAGFLLRVVCEAACLLLVTGVLMLLLAFRTAGRMVRDRPGRLERLAGAEAPWLIVTLLQAAVQLQKMRETVSDRVESGP